MKPCIKELLHLTTLIAGLGFIFGGRVTAQTFTTLHNFTATSGSLFTNSDGVYPNGILVVSGTLYGTAQDGGGSGVGAVFALQTDGTGFTNLHSFTALSSPFTGNNSDGAYPDAGLILSGNTLYGTASAGGSSGNGAVFAINTDGTGFTNLHSFTAFFDPFIRTNSDGAKLYAGLIVASNTLYGTASAGGSSSNGTVFAINTDGTGFTNLHSFTILNNNTNSDGAELRAELVLSSNTLYGTTVTGGCLGKGTVFAVKTDGTGFTNLYSFSAYAGSYPNYTNGDGAYPSGGLILSGQILYGTAESGGRSGKGTVFAIKTDGTGFTNLYNFTAASGSYPYYTNSDGVNPYAGLVLLGKTLYGTARSGGSSGCGTVFALNTDGTGFTNLHSFTGGNNGANPQDSLVISGNALYGTTYSGKGTVFSLSFAPQLTIISSETDVILTWPTNVAGFDYSGFTLQSTTNLVSPAVWSPVVPGPVVVNGQYAVTNAISGSQHFYRLSQ